MLQLVDWLLAYTNVTADDWLLEYTNVTTGDWLLAYTNVTTDGLKTVTR